MPATQLALATAIAGIDIKVHNATNADMKRKVAAYEELYGVRPCVKVKGMLEASYGGDGVAATSSYVKVKHIGSKHLLVFVDEDKIECVKSKCVTEWILKVPDTNKGEVSVD